MLTVLALTLAGCGGRRPRGHGGGPMGSEMSDELRERLRTARMETSGTFFDGSITVASRLSAGGLRNPEGRGDDGDGDRPDRPEGGRMRGGMGGGGGGMGGGPPGGGMRGGDDSDMPRVAMHASNMPPLKLRLWLTNHGTTEAVVEVLDFNSALGNFVVQPDKLVVPPGETVETEPMISRLGIPGDEIPLTVRLRSAGKTEQQVLTLRQVTPPPPDSAEKPPAN